MLQVDFCEPRRYADSRSAPEASNDVRFVLTKCHRKEQIFRGERSDLDLTSLESFLVNPIVPPGGRRVVNALPSRLQRRE